MNRRLLYHVVFATLISLVSSAKAQEPAAEAKPSDTENIFAGLENRYQQLAEQLKQELPKREIKIQIVEAQKTRLLQIDPKLLENKFVARFELVRSETETPRGPGSSDPNRTASQSLQKLFRDPIGAQLKVLVQQCPAEHRPNQRMSDFLTSDACGRDVRYAAEVRGMSRITLLFHVFAPTAEEADERARAIIRLYDVGFCRPLQHSLLTEGQKVLETLRSQNAELSQLSATIRTEDEKLVKQSEISGEIFSQLKAQKVMVAIELAGLSARVKACDAMLTDPKKLEVSTLQSVSDMKVRAEIERVGMKEKLDQINLFIAEGEAQTAANFRRSALGSKVAGLQNGIRSNEQVATRYAELVALYAPLQIPENQIAVGPIEWTQE